MGTNFRQTDSGGMAFVDDATSSRVFEIGGLNHRNTKIRKQALVGVAATTGGAILAWQNPENVAIIITRVDIDITTKSTGAANISMGTAADGVTSSANLIDTYAAGATEKVVSNLDDKGTLGKSTQKVAIGGFVNITGSASTVGLAGNVYIHYELT